MYQRTGWIGVLISSALGLVVSFSALAETSGKGESLSYEKNFERSYWVPLVDNLGFVFLLNQFDRHFLEDPSFRSDFGSIKNNLSRRWKYDSSRFITNQFLHPYAGLMYHGFARSAGHDFYVSMGYSHLGSWIWEMTGETAAPSINDQITTGFAGPFLGEAAFRLSQLWLDKRPFSRKRDVVSERSSTTGETAAAVISPASAFNRWLYGDRFDKTYPLHDPVVFTEMRFTANARVSEPSLVADQLQDIGVSTSINVSYGFPGKAGYLYKRPFDYFDFYLSAATLSGLESLSSYGWLWGAKYGKENRQQGLWGIFGGYDYLAKQAFQFSSTSLLVGNLNQWKLGSQIALQTSFFAGLGFGSSTSLGLDGELVGPIGTIPQGIARFRLIFGEDSILQAVGYYFFQNEVDGNFGDQEFSRWGVHYTIRLYRLHALEFSYQSLHHVSGSPSRALGSEGYAGVSYVLLSDYSLGATNWR